MRVHCGDVITKNATHLSHELLSLGHLVFYDDEKVFIISYH